MADMTSEIEKAPTEGAKKAKAGATMFTLTIWLLIGLIAGTAAAVTFKGDASLSAPPIGFALLIPLAIGVIQRTTSDKEVTWYKNEAQIAGLLIAGIAAFVTY